MKDFHETLRYEYDLTPESLVIDAGAHMGNFSRAIGRRYGCRILGFEPVAEFWCEAAQHQEPKTRIFQAGLGGSLRFVTFRVQGDSTGEFAGSDREETVLVIPVWAVLQNRPVDLFKLNIEGGEHEVMESVLQLGLQTEVANFQIQWHSIHPQAVDRMAAIRAELARTHELTFHTGTTWENWRLK